MTTSHVTEFPFKIKCPQVQTKKINLGLKGLHVIWSQWGQFFLASDNIDLRISCLCYAKEYPLNTQRQIPTLHFYLCSGGTRSNSRNWCFNSTCTHHTHKKKLLKLSNGCESCLGASWQRRDTNVMEHTCDFGEGEGVRVQARHRSMCTVCLRACLRSVLRLDENVARGLHK